MSTLEQHAKTLGLYVEHIGSVRDIRRMNGLGTTTQIPAETLTAEQKKCVAAYAKLADEGLDLIGRVIRYVAVSQLILGTTVGFGLGKVVKTNKNPSRLKTAMTVIGGGIVTVPASAAIGASIAIKSTPTDLWEAKELQGECEKFKTEIETEFKRLQKLPKEDRKKVLEELGLTEADIKTFEGVVENSAKDMISALTMLIAIALTVGVANAYHGYKRSGGLSALGFFLSGSTGLGVALAQGYGKPISSVETKE